MDSFIFLLTPRTRQKITEFYSNNCAKNALSSVCLRRSQQSSQLWTKVDGWAVTQPSIHRSKKKKTYLEFVPFHARRGRRFRKSNQKLPWELNPRYGETRGEKQRKQSVVCFYRVVGVVWGHVKYRSSRERGSQEFFGRRPLPNVHQRLTELTTEQIVCKARAEPNAPAAALIPNNSLVASPNSHSPFMFLFYCAWYATDYLVTRFPRRFIFQQRRS